MLTRYSLSRLLLLAVVGMLLPGAGASGAPAAPPAADQVTCYEGSSEVHLPDGRTFPGGTSIAKRTVSAAKGTIIEHVVAADGRPGVPPREYIVDMVVTDDMMTMTERSGAFTGRGTLTGPAWAWTSWRTESVLPDGMKVVSTDTVEGANLTAEKQITSAEGNPVVSISEHLKGISVAEFERKRAEMMGGKPGAAAPKLGGNAAPPPSDLKKSLNERTAATRLPQEQHDALAALVGEFATQSEVHLAPPPAEPMKAHATTVGKWIMGGLFVQVSAASDADEELKGERMVIYGFDPKAQKYTMWQVESGNDTATAATGDYDAATKTFTFVGDRDIGPSGKMTVIWSIRVMDGGSLSQLIKLKSPGAERATEFVSVTHTRKGGAGK